MILNIGSGGASLLKYGVYNLPGPILCASCSNGIVSGRPENTGNKMTDASFYPNPVKDHLKLKYELPPNTKKLKLKSMINREN
jgi:hypothetical protein